MRMNNPIFGWPRNNTPPQRDLRVTPDRKVSPVLHGLLALATQLDGEQLIRRILSSRRPSLSSIAKRDRHDLAVLGRELALRSNWAVGNRISRRVQDSYDVTERVPTRLFAGKSMAAWGGKDMAVSAQASQIHRLAPHAVGSVRVAAEPKRCILCDKPHCFALVTATSP
jgi:hypothetical protein